MKINARLTNDTDRNTYTKKAIYTRTKLVEQLNENTNAWVTDARYIWDVEHNRETVWLTFEYKDELPVNVWGDSHEGILYDCTRAAGAYVRDKRLKNVTDTLYRMAREIEGLTGDVRPQDLLNDFDDYEDYMNGVYDTLIDITTIIEDRMEYEW